MTETIEAWSQLGRDPFTIPPLTGQRKVAAAALPYVKFALIGSTKRVPRDFADSNGLWPMKLVVTSDVAGSLRLIERNSRDAHTVHFEAWTDLPRDVAQAIKDTFDAELTNAGRLIKDGMSLFDVEPELALQGFLTLCKQRNVILYDNSWYDAEVTKRAEANARLFGRAAGRR